MPFTEYRYDAELIKALVAERAASLRANRGFSNLLRFGLGVIAQRLDRDRRRYRDYGPYWFALKDALNAAGYNLGQQSDPLVKAVYRGADDTETLVMADQFRTDYLKRFMIYSNQFMLDADSGDMWELYDGDMEQPRGAT